MEVIYSDNTFPAGLIVIPTSATSQKFSIPIPSKHKKPKLTKYWRKGRRDESNKRYGGEKYVEKKHTRREIHSALSLYYVSTNAWATQINIIN